ncbi:helicase HerA domain-containing protein [Novosphingobium sp.]|uniref:helicase HerA domain-containing protein n=1 Tax=Novosphingobium sp. TaxID=1874826 RepID=UPI00286EA0E2|nr:DUF87 domain-containing protein [Novosphingobium sp.]
MSHPIPFEALDGKVGVMGVTGTGKTYTAIGLVELLLDAGRQVIIIDPTGAYNGLRTAFPIPIFGGKFGDVEIGEDSGEAVARAIIDHDLSAIVDVSLLLKQSHAAARRFMAPFVAVMKNAPARARYLAMDEADEFMPENASGSVAQLFGDLKWIVRRGRIEGWRMLMVTQRPQDIAKSVLTQCETMVIHKLTAPQDRKALLEWVKGTADTAEGKIVLDSLARLETGEAWVWSPRHDLLQRVRMPANRSEDRSKTPDADDAPHARLGFQAVDMGAIRATLAAPMVANEGQALDPALKAELEALRDERDEWTIERATGQQQLDELLAVIARYQEAERTFFGMIADIQWPSVARADGSMPSEPRIIPGVQVVAEKPVATPKTKIAQREPSEAPAGLNAAARKMVEMLDRIAPARVPWGSLAAMIGNKARGGNFNSARKAMRESGLIVEDGDTVRSARPPAEGMRRDQAFSLWSDVLANPAPRMMIALKEEGGLTRSALGANLGIVPRGGNFNNGVAQLIRNGVAVDRGGVLHLADPLPGESA